MKPASIALLLLGALATPAWAQNNAAPTPVTIAPAAPATNSAAELDARFKDSMEKNSYSIGVMLANDMKRNLQRGGYEVDPAIVAKAFSAFFTGQPTTVTEAEAQTVVRSYSMELRQKAEEKRKAEAGKNKNEGEAFLAPEGMQRCQGRVQRQAIAERHGPFQGQLRPGLSVKPIAPGRHGVEAVVAAPQLQQQQHALGPALAGGAAFGLLAQCRGGQGGPGQQLKQGAPVHASCHTGSANSRARVERSTCAGRFSPSGGIGVSMGSSWGGGDAEAHTSSSASRAASPRRRACSQRRLIHSSLTGQPFTEGGSSTGCPMAAS